MTRTDDVDFVEIGGRRLVVMSLREYERLHRAAGEPADGPPDPPEDEGGRMDALAFADASIARDVLLKRRERGLTQKQLAERAGVRPETVSRIESGRHAPRGPTVDRVLAALEEPESSGEPR